MDRGGDARYPDIRLRRYRRSPALRELLAEVDLSPRRLIAPLFVAGGTSRQDAIASMPGQFRYSVDTAVETVRRWADLGLHAVLLFGVPDKKDAHGSAAWDDQAPVQQLIRRIRRDCPATVVLADVCLCEYTDHGHCGPLVRRADKSVTVDNDAALPLLARTAVSLAKAGADMVAPSAMMDGQVRAIRSALDAAGMQDTAILSYAAKFASAFYGPFRDAADSAPSEGDRRSYQMDPRCGRQALLEARCDQAEGADMLMVKPAAACLDVIAAIRSQTDLPLAAYHVSGEYAMIKAAAANGWLDERPAVLETTSAIRRAGADLIITYYAQELARWLT